MFYNHHKKENHRVEICSILHATTKASHHFLILNPVVHMLIVPILLLRHQLFLLLHMTQMTITDLYRYLNWLAMSPSYPSHPSTRGHLPPPDHASVSLPKPIPPGGSISSITSPWIFYSRCLYPLACVNYFLIIVVSEVTFRLFTVLVDNNYA